MSAVSFQGQRPVRHHPSNALLLAYAAGAADPAMMLLLATHLSFCGRCRGLAARAENVGAARLEDIAPHPWAPGKRDHLIRISADLVSGRRLRATATTRDGYAPYL